MIFLEFLESLVQFWRSYPALLYGLSFFLGISYALNASPLLFFPFISLWFPFIFLGILTRHKSYLLMWLFGCLLTFFAWIYPPKIEISHFPMQGIRGRAYLDIESLQLNKTFFGRHWVYHCRLKEFEPQQTDSTSSSPYTGASCLVRLPDNPKWQRPLANCCYWVEGVLQKTDSGHLIFKIEKTQPWHIIPNSWRAAELRFQSKQSLKSWIFQRIPYTNSATFLAGLATGEFEDPLMQQQLGRFGLQHIMAISGFHFALLAGILHFFFRLICSPKISALLTFVLVTGYLLFLGPSPSVLRAWVMISVYLLGICIQKQSQALNSLGLALIVVLIFDPSFSQHLGFQFSFLTTAAILLHYAVFDHYLSGVLMKRPLSQMIEMNGWNQHGYYLLSLFRQGLALALAVNAFAFPFMLYTFQQFPWMSLLYNLFFPPLASVALFLLLIGLSLDVGCPPLAQMIHTLNGFYTEWMLNLVYKMPTTLDQTYQVSHFSLKFLILYLCLLTLAGIWIKHRLKASLQDNFLI